MNLPDALQPFKQQILATQKPVIHLTLSPADDLPLWASKIGGRPYLPKDTPYPRTHKGDPLLLLAQFNLSELPMNKLLPTTGILSFFISTDDDLYGNLYDNPTHQDAFRVLYFKDVIQDTNALQSDFSSIYAQLQDIDGSLFPIYGDVDVHELDKLQFQPTFCLDNQVISYHDFNFEQNIFDGKSFYHDILKGDNQQFYDIVDKYFETSGHHLLGYPYFAQEDNRPYHANTKEYELLFQLDSEVIGEMEILWGDSGVGNFFIHPDDLNNQDFSKVAFYWDCC